MIADNEIWIPIQGYSKYLVSNKGRIKTIQIRCRGKQKTSLNYLWRYGGDE